MDKIPQHRAAMEPRSGDTHVIGADGEAKNIDQAARDAAAKAQRPAVPEPASARAKKASS